MPVQPLGERPAEYDKIMQGCVAHIGEYVRGLVGLSTCTFAERGRVKMNLEQPAAMTNYTETGYKKTRVPGEIMDLISAFWKMHRHTAKAEKWARSNTYTNDWESPSFMVSLSSPILKGGQELRRQLTSTARGIISSWTGQDLRLVSLYGIRVYTANSMLAPHVDRLPLISSAIINVAQDLDEPWPLEVYGRDGQAVNITMTPGDMVLYESHSLLHGRPFPMKGRYMANIFIHFEPTTPQNKAIGQGSAKTPNLRRGSRRYKKREKPAELERAPVTGTTIAHSAAFDGDLDKIRGIIEKDTSLVHSKDENGFLPLHEAARNGHTEIVRFLYESGADLNARTNHGKGGTALWWAKNDLGHDHAIVSYLESLGAMEVGPEL